MWRRVRDGAARLRAAAGHDRGDGEVSRPSLALLGHHPLASCPPTLRVFHIHETTLSTSVQH